MLPFHDKTKVLKNPEILLSSKVPTIFWKLDGQRIVEMTREEKLSRLELLEEKGREAFNWTEVYPWLKKRTLWSCVGVVVVIILSLYISKHVSIN